MTSNTNTTSWPWTNDLPFAVADPIEPIDEYDDRPLIKDLIQKHDRKIGAMKKSLENNPLYEPNKHDDLWILRFLLSHKNKVQLALGAAEYTLAFRHKHQLDKVDVRNKQPAGPNSFINAMRLFSKHIQPGAMAYTVPDTQRGVVIFYHSTLMDTHKIVEEFDEHPHWLDYHMNLSEWMFQWNDYVSRKTGRLTKSIMIFNMEGLGMSGLNKEYQERNKRANEEIELCYPQKTGSFFAVNVPQWVFPVWRIIRLFLTKRILEKVDVVDPQHSPRDKAKLLKYMAIDILPKRFGGSYQSWPVEYATQEEPTEQQPPKKACDKREVNHKARMQKSPIEIVHTPEGCKERIADKAVPKKRRWWKQRKEEGNRKNFIQRRRNGKGVGGQGDLLVMERREMSDCTTYFSAPLA